MYFRNLSDLFSVQQVNIEGNKNKFVLPQILSHKYLLISVPKS